MAMWCTQWPVSAVGSGMYCDFSPWLIGFQVLPPSSVRNAPAAEMAIYMRFSFLGSIRIAVQTQPARARLPARPAAMAAQARQLVPGLAAIGGLEQRRILDAGETSVGIAQRRLQMPDALELPRMLRAVVPHVRGQRFAGLGRDVVGELVALALGEAFGRLQRLLVGGTRHGPGLAAIVRALNDLPEPAATTARDRCGSGPPANLWRDRFPSRRNAVPATSQVLRLPSDERTNAPFLVPTSTRTPVMLGLLDWCGGGLPMLRRLS